jgi:hypothetical protein
VKQTHRPALKEKRGEAASEQKQSTATLKKKKAEQVNR